MDTLGCPHTKTKPNKKRQQVYSEGKLLVKILLLHYILALFASWTLRAVAIDQMLPHVWIWTLTSRFVNPNSREKHFTIGEKLWTFGKLWIFLNNSFWGNGQSAGLSAALGREVDGREGLQAHFDGYDLFYKRKHIFSFTEMIYFQRIYISQIEIFIVPKTIHIIHKQKIQTNPEKYWTNPFNRAL